MVERSALLTACRSITIIGTDCIRGKAQPNSPP